MISTELLFALVGGLVAVLAFLLRHYFLRIERHLARNHELFTVLTRHELRIERLETKVFGHPFAPTLRATDEQPPDQ